MADRRVALGWARFTLGMAQMSGAVMGLTSLVLTV